MLTTAEASTVLGVKPKTVAIYINRGLLTAEKKGRDYLITGEEIARFQRERRNPGNPGTKRGPKKAPTESLKRYPTAPSAERDT